MRQRRQLPRGTFTAGKPQSPGVETREVTFVEARRMGLKETTVDEKKFFKPVKKVEKN